MSKIPVKIISSVKNHKQPMKLMTDQFLTDKVFYAKTSSKK